MKSFGSDNHAPVHPDVLAAIVAANDGDAASYGADPWTAQAKRLFAEHFPALGEKHQTVDGLAPRGPFPERPPALGAAQTAAESAADARHAPLRRARGVERSEPTPVELVPRDQRA